MAFGVICHPWSTKIAKITMTKEKLRWQYRFNNFRRTYTLLLEALDLLYEKNSTNLARKG